MFIVVLFTIAKIWEKLKCPSSDKWIDKMDSASLVLISFLFWRLKLHHGEEHRLRARQTWFQGSVLPRSNLGEVKPYEPQFICSVSLLCRSSAEKLSFLIYSSAKGEDIGDGGGQPLQDHLPCGRVMPPQR